VRCYFYVYCFLFLPTDDAPSLKKADCGIAVEGASDAARAAADVVFLDEGLSTIITSIKVARQIFHSM
jgi:H+-transporting ATPase